MIREVGNAAGNTPITRKESSVSHTTAYANAKIPSLGRKFSQTLGSKLNHTATKNPNFGEVKAAGSLAQKLL